MARILQSEIAPGLATPGYYLYLVKTNISYETTNPQCINFAPGQPDRIQQGAFIHRIYRRTYRQMADHPGKSRQHVFSSIPGSAGHEWSNAGHTRLRGPGPAAIFR